MKENKKNRKSVAVETVAVYLSPSGGKIGMIISRCLVL